MDVVRAERWHLVDTAGKNGASTRRRCSVCGMEQLYPRDGAVLDSASRQRFRVVRCAGCGYDLLEPLIG